MADAKRPYRRKHCRLDKDYLLKYETSTDGSGLKITNIKNLSAGGLKFLTDEILPEASAIVIDLCIPPLERSFKAKAVIVRTRKTRKNMIFSVAVRFIDISSQEQKIINDFVEAFAAHMETEGVALDPPKFVVRATPWKKTDNG